MDCDQQVHFYNRHRLCSPRALLRRTIHEASCRADSGRCTVRRPSTRHRQVTLRTMSSPCLPTQARASRSRLPAETKIVKLAAGSTDLKTAQPAQVSDIAVGDRVLATGKAGDTPASLTAARLILMKSADIAEKNAQDQAQWRTNGAGGIVSAVDSASGTIVLTSGTNKVTVTTSSQHRVQALQWRLGPVPGRKSRNTRRHPYRRSTAGSRREVR